MESYSQPEPINVGTGEDIAIRDVAEIMRDVVYPEARLVFDRSKPDGQPRRRVDVDRLHAAGWRHRVSLRQGIASTYEWFLQHQHDARLESPSGVLTRPA